MSQSIIKKRGNHNRKRKFPGVKGRRPDLKVCRQDEALARAVERSKLTASELITLLDQRFGRGIGAVRERARLNKQIIAENKARRAAS